MHAETFFLLGSTSCEHTDIFSSSIANYNRIRIRPATQGRAAHEPFARVRSGQVRCVLLYIRVFLHSQVHSPHVMRVCSLSIWLRVDGLCVASRLP